MGRHTYVYSAPLPPALRGERGRGEGGLRTPRIAPLSTTGHGLFIRGTRTSTRRLGAPNPPSSLPLSPRKAGGRGVEKKRCLPSLQSYTGDYFKRSSASFASVVRRDGAPAAS